MQQAKKNKARIRRHQRVRTKVAGTADRPRMAIFKSNTNLYVQFIDDEARVTLAQASTQSGDFKGKPASIETAKALGTVAAEAAKAQGIDSVVFDRGGFSYEGKIAALADSAREAGLKF